MHNLVDICVRLVHCEEQQPLAAADGALHIVVFASGAIVSDDVRGSAGDVLVLPPHVMPWTARAGAAAVRYSVRGTLLQRILAYVPERAVFVDGDRVRDAIARLTAELHRADAVTPLAVEAALCDVVARAARLAAPRPSHSTALAAAMLYVERHIAERITVRSLAAAGGTSPRAMTARFAAELMTSPLDYVRGERLRKAAASLMAGDEPLADLAARLGFYDHAHFSRSFREMYGVTPSEYRRQAALAARAVAAGNDD